jgi:hypothetical protein
MTRRQLLFYATALDLGSALSLLEAERPLQYTLTGMFKTNCPRTYLSYSEIPDLGRAIHSSAVANPFYLLSSRGTPVHVREVLQTSGEVLFAIDQMENMDTIVLSPGGQYGNDVILYGMIGTVSHSAKSKELFVFVSKALRESFDKVREYFVGPEARDAWKAGVRLTIGASSPSNFDLRA